ncbi:MAG TPA: polymer-forming cytoskeletal protein [Burkholderiales bacterium]|jgi:cytoskeletal protein CcmA (bactofilin family)|nr:polymer-forming cytoskeletal protein [Burkholderiales bacterium]
MLNKQNLFGTNDRYRRDTLSAGGQQGSVTTSPPQPSAEARPAVTTTPTPTPGAMSESVKAAPVEDPKGSRLTVGPDIKLKGAEITDCDTLVVEGRVEASMDSRVIQIAESGSFQGNVGIDVAEIRGEFIGELTARKQLIIRATGRVSGVIRYGKLVIEEGGELAGDVASIAGANKQAPGKVTSGVKPNLQTTGTH